MIGVALDQAYDAKAIRFADARGFRPRHIKGTYVLAFCGVTHEGRKFVIVDGIYNFLGNMVCNDAAGFGIVYDPRDKKFGPIAFGVSSCVPRSQKKS